MDLHPNASESTSPISLSAISMGIDEASQSSGIGVRQGSLKAVSARKSHVAGHGSCSAAFEGSFEANGRRS